MTMRGLIVEAMGPCGAQRGLNLYIGDGAAMLNSKPIVGENRAAFDWYTPVVIW